MSFTRVAVSITGNITAGSNVIASPSSTVTLYLGMAVYGTGIPADTVLTALTPNVTMSANATSTVTGASITGQYITQTGNDADPSGLSAMTGVTTITSGTGSRLKSIFDLGTNQLRIQGTLTHDPDQYTFVSGLQMAIRVESGAYNYGIETTVNGKTSYSKSCGLELTYQGGIASNFPIQISGGAFNWRGGIIRLGGAFSIAGGSFNQKGDTSVVYNNNTGTQIQLRTILAPANMKYEKIKLAGVNQVFFWTTQTYGAISAALENGGIQTPAGFSATQTYVDFEFANNQAPADFYINQLSSASSTLSIVKNPDVIPRVSQLNTGAYGVVETRTALTFNVTDSNGVSAANVVGYVKDSNNGARTNENQLTTYTSDQVYIASSTVGGVLSLGDVLVDVQMRNPSATNTVKHDYRSNFGNGSTDFNVFLGGYEFNPVSTRQSLIGNGGKSVAWTMFADSNITLSRAAALTKLSNSFVVDPVAKTVTVTANSTYDDLYDALKAYKYQGTQAAVETPLIDKLILAANGTNLTAYTGWILIVNTGVTLSEGIKFNYIYFDTIEKNGTITGIYGTTDGISTVLEIRDIANNAALFVGDNATHVADLYAVNSTGLVKTYVLYYPPGSAGKQKLIARALYGYLLESELVTLAAGKMWWTTTDTLDTVIDVTNQSTVAAYTVLDTPNKTYDYSRYQELSYPWLGLVSKDGNSLYFGNVNFKVDKTASNIWNYDTASNTLTVKATTFNKGSTMYEAKSDGLITIDNGATIAIPYQDSLGARGTILGLDPKSLGGNWHVRYKLQSATSWTELNGTGNSTAILYSTTGIYDIQVAANGYDRKTLTLDTTSGVTVDVSLLAHLAADETPQYLKTYDHSIANIFQYDAATGKVVVTNTSLAILQPSYAEVYQAIDRIMNDPALVWSFSNPVKTNSVAQTITIPNGNPLEMYLSSNSNASVQLTCSVLLGTTGELAYSRLKGNAAGYMIILGSPADATSAGLKNQIVTELQTLLGGINFDTTKHSLANIKTELDTVQTSVDSLGI